MARSGSLPWVLLVAVLSTAFAIWIEASFIHPVESAITGTTLWQTNELSYAYEGRQRVANFVRYILTVWVLGIWFGVLITARRSV